MVSARSYVAQNSVTGMSGPAARLAGSKVGHFISYVGRGGVRGGDRGAVWGSVGTSACARGGPCNILTNSFPKLTLMMLGAGAFFVFWLSRRRFMTGLILAFERSKSLLFGGLSMVACSSPLSCRRY